MAMNWNGILDGLGGVGINTQSSLNGMEGRDEKGLGKLMMLYPQCQAGS